MELTPKTPIKSLYGVGEVRAAAFNKLGIFTAYELLCHYPREYENRGDTKSIMQAFDGEICSIIATVCEKPQTVRTRTGMNLTRVIMGDDSGSMELVFFNNNFIASAMAIGRKFRIYGRVNYGQYGKEMLSPQVEAMYEGKLLPQIVPRYPLTKGLTQYNITQAVKAVLPLCSLMSDIIPADMRERNLLLKRGEAVLQLHTPACADTLAAARRTMAFEELLLLQLALRELKSGITDKISRPITQKNTGIGKFFTSLPFSLTKAQQRSVKEIFADLAQEKPMMRLLQGDVGSGKTVIAAAAMFLTVCNNMQAAMTAPTEILASQHQKTLQKLFEPFAIEVALLTSSTPKKQKDAVKSALKDGKISVIVGTHALLQPDVEFSSLGLVITDEQHRFGVKQREALTEKGKAFTPHTLVMSATPIPRSLSLILYGDLDVSVLDELPPGRQKIETRVVSSDRLEKTYSFIKKQAEIGFQAYIICPLVEDNPESDRAAAESAFEELKNGFLSGVPMGLLHGRLSAKEKSAVMADFSSEKIKVLVSTTVVEVGVDVPNATVMLIKNAECFGLSQLHQLRGRIGRGSGKSYCILQTDKENEKSKKRLAVLENSEDGFEIAEQDLLLRGPGDFFGERQSGEITLKCANIADMQLIAKTKQEVDTVCADPDNPDYAPLRSFSKRMVNFKNPAL